jgi:predicted transposase/invertase (TIGR01784 family)
VEQEILAAKYDTIFKRIFADKNYVNTLINFLKAVLDLPDDEYYNLTIADPHLTPLHKDGKLFVLDLKLQTVGGKIIHIEIQITTMKGLRERIMAYGSRLLSEQLAKGEHYDSLHKVITILITDFSLIDESSEYHNKFLMRNDTGNITLTEIFEIHVLELTKIPPAEDGNIIWRWLKLLTTDNQEELDMLEQHYPELKEPILRIKQLSADERVREEFWAQARDRYDAAARLREAMAEGEARGRAEERTALVRSMLQRGLHTDDIAKLTGLTLEEIEKADAQLC